MKTTIVFLSSYNRAKYPCAIIQFIKLSIARVDIHFKLAHSVRARICNIVIKWIGQIRESDYIAVIEIRDL